MTTFLKDLLEPKVYADWINDFLLSEMSFSDLAQIDRTLVGTRGTVLTIPIMKYIGDAVDVAEGQTVEGTKLQHSEIDRKIKKVMKKVILTDEAIENSIGNPLEETAMQLTMSIAQKLNKDCFETLKTEIPANMTADLSAESISSSAISKSLVKFGEKLSDRKVLLLSAGQLDVLRHDPSYINGSELSTEVLMKGSLGMLWGCEIQLSDSIVPDSETGTIENYIVKPSALSLLLKKDVKIEIKRDIERQIVTFVATHLYLPYL